MSNRIDASNRIDVSKAIILGVSTAGPVAAAVIAGDAEYAVASSGQALAGTLPAVTAVLEAARVKIDELTLIVVCTGPGSFTGLRIGVAFAKSLAQALGLPIIGVSAYDVAEWNAHAGTHSRAAIVPGKRDYFYARVSGKAGAGTEFVRGSGEQIDNAVGNAARFWLSALSSEEIALRVARIGQECAAGGAVGDWRTLAIDYGQRPNAVVNWEARRRGRERGGAPSAANLPER